MFRNFVSENRALHGAWKNMAPTLTCRLTKVTILTKFNIYCFPTATMATQICLYITLYAHCLSSCYQEYEVFLMRLMRCIRNGAAYAMRIFVERRPCSMDINFCVVIVTMCT
jgi:hypothetical protein